MLHISTERGIGLAVGLVLGILAYFLLISVLPQLAQLTWIYT